MPVKKIISVLKQHNVSDATIQKILKCDSNHSLKACLEKYHLKHIGKLMKEIYSKSKAKQRATVHSNVSGNRQTVNVNIGNKGGTRRRAPARKPQVAPQIHIINVPQSVQVPQAPLQNPPYIPYPNIPQNVPVQNPPVQNPPVQNPPIDNAILRNLRLDNFAFEPERLSVATRPGSLVSGPIEAEIPQLPARQNIPPPPPPPQLILGSGAPAIPGVRPAGFEEQLKAATEKRRVQIENPTGTLSPLNFINRLTRTNEQELLQKQQQELLEQSKREKAARDATSQGQITTVRQLEENARPYYPESGSFAEGSLMVSNVEPNVEGGGYAEGFGQVNEQYISVPEGQQGFADQLLSGQENPPTKSELFNEFSDIIAQSGADVRDVSKLKTKYKRIIETNKGQKGRIYNETFQDALLLKNQLQKDIEEIRQKDKEKFDENAKKKKEKATEAELAHARREMLKADRKLQADAREAKRLEKEKEKERPPKKISKPSKSNKMPVDNPYITPEDISMFIQRGKK